MLALEGRTVELSWWDKPKNLNAPQSGYASEPSRLSGGPSASLQYHPLEIISGNLCKMASPAPRCKSGGLTWKRGKTRDTSGFMSTQKAIKYINIDVKFYDC